ncbi:MAG: hypothetical protein ACUVX8_11630 [Candidatus Zipacnadales bacterium]
MNLRSHRWMSVLGLAVVLHFTATTVMGAAALSSLVPGQSEIVGWVALQADKAAASPNELWKIYDGGDGPWKAAGVTSAFQRYYKSTSTKRVLTLILHKTGSDWQKAKALYAQKNASIQGQTGYTSINVKAAGSLATPAQGLTAHMWNKYYYCTVTVNGTSSEDIEAAKKFLATVSAKITKNG